MSDASHPNFHGGGTQRAPTHCDECTPTLGHDRNGCDAERRRRLATRLDCGHGPTPTRAYYRATCVPITPGYATDPEGRRLCYRCAERDEQAAFAAGTQYTGFIDAPGQRITTWTGATLAKIIEARRGDNGLRYVWAVDPAGRRWWGSGSPEVEAVTLRRLKD